MLTLNRIETLDNHFSTFLETGSVSRTLGDYARLDNKLGIEENLLLMYSAMCCVYDALVDKLETAIAVKELGTTDFNELDSSLI